MRRSVGASGSAATFLHTAAAGKAVALPPWSVRWVAYRNRDYWEPLFDLDVSEPLGLCAQEYGVFTREFSKGMAALNCNTFEATLAFQMKS